VILLVPADVLVPRRPDEMFAAEAAAARQFGIPVAVIDHDAITQFGDARQAVAQVPEGHPDAVYRGWMMRAAQYEALAEALCTGDSAAHHARAVPAGARASRLVPGLRRADPGLRLDIRR